MEAKEMMEKVTTGKMTRRDFKKALAALGLGLVAGPMVSRRGLASTEDHPVVFTWEGYEEEGFHTNYMDKYGELPNFTFFGDEEEAFAKIRAGFKPDISMPCSYKIPFWRDAGVIQPLDTARLTNWPDIIPSLKNIPGMVVDGERHWVCMDWAQTSITYREDLVEIDEESWGLLWDERYTGRLSMMDSLIDGVMVAAIYGGAKDPFNMTPEEVAKTRDLLREQLPLLRYYASSPTDIENALASGELVAGVTWNDSYARLKKEGIPVKFMQPKEGAMTWTCGVSLMTDADPAKIDKCYDFIDSVLSPEAGAYEITEWFYGHANQKAFDMVDDATLAELGVSRNPDELLSSGILQQPIQNEPELQTMFEQVKTGA